MKEFTQLLVPGHSGYETIDITDIIVADSGIGAPPLHYVTQRSAYQHGETVIGVRLDPRVIQLVIEEELIDRERYWDRRHELHSLFGVYRNFDYLGVSTPCVLRKIRQGTQSKWRSDLVTTNGDATITSTSAKFAHWGLQVGDTILITTGADGGYHEISDIVNENTLELAVALTADATDITYYVESGIMIRDVDVYKEAGPTFANVESVHTRSYKDVLRFVAFDPVMYNPLEQRASVAILDEANLIFYESPDWENRAEFPIWFGFQDVWSQFDVAYYGTWQSRPKIVATGPFAYISVANLDTNHMVAMDYGAEAGEIITIDLHTLRAYNNLGLTLTKYLTDDLVSLYLWPDPIVEDGINSMEVYIYGGIVDVTDVTMYWKARYSGI